MDFEGGCLCGAVRYRARGPFTDLVYCHCRACQRSAGAPVLAWLTVERARFAFIKGQPKTYASSAKGRRDFCANCGAQLLFHGENPNQIDITTASLDNPALAPPQFHIWRMSRVAWFDTADTLPRHNERGPNASA